MFERFTRGKDEFHRLKCNRIIGVIRIFRDETGELAPFNEFFGKRGQEA